MKSLSNFFPGLFKPNSSHKISLTGLGTFALTLLWSSLSFSADNANLEVQKEIQKDNIYIKFLPSKSHHLNTKAPNMVTETRDNKNTKLEISVKKEGLSVLLKKADDCLLNYKIYICDDANTYCLPKEGSYQCKENKLSESQVSNVKEITALKPEEKNSFFIMNNPTLALQKAKIENKPLMIDFFGTWCPPCNVLDETVFAHPKFKEFQNKMVFLKLDADLPISWELKAKYAIKGYPTVVFTTPDNEEIYRIIGSMTPNNFLKKMDYVIKNKNQSIKDLLKAYAANKTPQTAWKLIDAYNNQEDYTSAFDLIPMALKKNNLTPKEQDLIQYIQLKFSLNQSTKENKAKFTEFIKNSIESFPNQETFLDKLTILDNLAEESKDESLTKWVALQTLKITNDLMVHKISEDSFISQTDIYFIRADAFEKLGSKTEAQFVYKLATKEIEQQIKKYKLDIKTNRGFNLDRVYAIYKSGDFPTADTLYKDLIKVYPEEFTFYYNHASVLKELNKKEEALTQAQKALDFSYGDNKLRAAYLTADLMKDLDKKSESKKVIDEVITSFSLPENKSIRTHRYYKKLVDLKESLSK